MTQAIGDTTVHVICDGYGPFGHIASFRVAQSLPKFMLEGLEVEEEPSQSVEQIATKAFKLAGADLVQFASVQDFDLAGSGATVACALRRGENILVGWLGDSRVLVATVAGEYTKIDLMAKPHTPNDRAEKQRLDRLGAVLLEHPSFGGEEASLRIFGPRGGADAPGLSVSRALADSEMSAAGVITQPGLAKTSFASAPGLVLLGSGGLCEHFGDGASMLNLLLQQGRLLEEGPQYALACLCASATEQWQQEAPGHCEDVTGILLHWPPTLEQAAAAAAAPPARALPASPAGGSLVASSAPSSPARLPLHVAPTQSRATELVGALGQASAAVPAPVAAGGASGAATAPAPVQRFLQALPRGAVQPPPRVPPAQRSPQVELPRQEPTPQRFLQALPPHQRHNSQTAVQQHLVAVPAVSSQVPQQGRLEALTLPASAWQPRVVGSPAGRTAANAETAVSRQRSVTPSRRAYALATVLE